MPRVIRNGPNYVYHFIASLVLILSFCHGNLSHLLGLHPKHAELYTSGYYFPVQKGLSACHQTPNATYRSNATANLSTCCPERSDAWHCPAPGEPDDNKFCCYARHDCAYCCTEKQFFSKRDLWRCDRQVSLVLLSVGAFVLLFICAITCWVLVPGGRMYKRIFGTAAEEEEIVSNTKLAPPESKETGEEIVPNAKLAPTENKKPEEEIVSNAKLAPPESKKPEEETLSNAKPTPKESKKPVDPS